MFNCLYVGLFCISSGTCSSSKSLLVSVAINSIPKLQLSVCVLSSLLSNGRQFDIWHLKSKSEVQFQIICEFQINNSSKHNQFLLFVDVSVSIKDFHQKKKLVLVLPVLGMTRTWTWRAKKVVVCVTELIAAFTAIHGLCTFLVDVYGLLDQPGTTVWLSVNHCHLRPVDRVILLVCVVCYSGFVDLC